MKQNLTTLRWQTLQKYHSNDLICVQYVKHSMQITQERWAIWFDDKLKMTLTSSLSEADSSVCN